MRACAAGEAPTGRVSRVGSGSLLTKALARLRPFGRLGLIDGPGPRIFGGQAAGLRRRSAHAFPTNSASPGTPNTVAHTRSRSATPPTGDLAVATPHRTQSGAPSTPSPRKTNRRAHALLAETTACRRERRTASHWVAGADRSRNAAISARPPASSLRHRTGSKPRQQFAELPNRSNDPECRCLLKFIRAGK